MSVRLAPDKLAIKEWPAYQGLHAFMVNRGMRERLISASIFGTNHVVGVVNGRKGYCNSEAFKIAACAPSASTGTTCRWW